jgi:hypothetical protein
MIQLGHRGSALSEWPVIRPKESIRLPGPDLRDMIASQREKQMRMLGSFIIHYVGLTS